jgi:hypothetical protein
MPESKNQELCTFLFFKTKKGRGAQMLQHKEHVAGCNETRRRMREIMGRVLNYFTLWWMRSDL